jgi:Domain of unknown function (DUF202)
VSEGGAAAERTRLAWRRTGATVALGAVVLGRLALPELGYAAAAAAAVTVAGAMWVLITSSRRRRLTPDPGVDPELADSVLVDGWAPAVITAVVVLLFLLEITAILAP